MGGGGGSKVGGKGEIEGKKRRQGKVGQEGGREIFKTQFVKMGKCFKKKAKNQTTLHVTEFKYLFELTLATPNRSHCRGLR